MSWWPASITVAVGESLEFTGQAVWLVNEVETQGGILVSKNKVGTN